MKHLEKDLADLEARGLLRQRPEPWRGRASFCSNDYLGLGWEGVSGVGAYPGATASRLVAGEKEIHQLLERDLADWVGAESALCFTSGYAANVGVMSALAGPQDVVISDALNHASIIDGIRLSRAEVIVTPHLDVDAVERAVIASKGRRTWVVVESYFSMDADTPDLARLRRITTEHGAFLIVDEAHALGVFGERGLCHAAGVVPDALVGTLGKAVGVQGGFVAGSPNLVAWLWNRARSFVFSTGISPILALVARTHVHLVRTHCDDHRARVSMLSKRLRGHLLELEQDVRGYGHIVPWVLGDRAIAIASKLRTQGFEVQGIRPPTVPTSRIRLTITARHAERDVDDLVSEISSILR